MNRIDYLVGSQTDLAFIGFDLEKRTQYTYKEFKNIQDKNGGYFIHSAFLRKQRGTFLALGNTRKITNVDDNSTTYEFKLNNVGILYSFGE